MTKPKDPRTATLKVPSEEKSQRELSLTLYLEPGEVWVIQCCVCHQYFDMETKERLDKPPESASVTHTYCDRCFDDAMTALIGD